MLWGECILQAMLFSIPLHFQHLVKEYMLFLFNLEFQYVIQLLFC